MESGRFSPRPYQLYTAVCGLTLPIGIHIYELLCLCQYSTNCLVNAQRCSHSLSTVMVMMYTYVYGPCTSNEWLITLSATQYHHAWSHCAVFTTRGGSFSVCYTSSHDEVCTQSISESLEQPYYSMQGNIFKATHREV